MKTATTDDGASRPTIPMLDGVRGLAILLVLGIHISIISEPRSAFEMIFRRATHLGWTGVDLFFVLSGFLITGILDKTSAHPHYFRNFYFRRLLRVFPLYYATLLILCVVVPSVWGYSSTEGKIMVSRQAWAWTYGVNILITILPSHSFYVLTHFWSLAVEEHFYLFWPFLIRLCSRRTAAWVCIAILVAAPAFRWFTAKSSFGWHGAFLLTHCRMDALAIGALIALAPRLGIPSLWLPRVSPWAVTLSFSCLAMIWWPKADLDRFNDPVFGIYGYTLLAVFWGAAMLTALSYASGNPVRKILECGTLRFFGKYSYGLYVLHWPLLVFFNEQMELLNWFERKLASRTLAAVLFDAVALVTCVVAAYLCYHSFERRFLDLKRHFDYRNP